MPAAQDAHIIAAGEVVVEPVLHRVHTEPLAAEMVPTGHASQNEDPTKLENVPARHGKQIDELLAPSMDENVPDPQRVHTVAPRTDE